MTKKTVKDAVALIGLGVAVAVGGACGSSSSGHTSTTTSGARPSARSIAQVAAR